jgi:hypothetical protein
MSEAAANAALMRRYYEEVFNRRNLAFLREHLHPDVVGHGPGAYDRLDLYDRQLGGWRP